MDKYMHTYIHFPMYKYTFKYAQLAIQVDINTYEYTNILMLA